MTGVVRRFVGYGIGRDNATEDRPLYSALLGWHHLGFGIVSAGLFPARYLLYMVSPRDHIAVAGRI